MGIELHERVIEDQHAVLWSGRIDGVDTRLWIIDPGPGGPTAVTAAKRDLRDVQRLGYDGLPVCIAKTPASLSDDPKRRGRPDDFEVTVREIQINAGAGFLVVLTGDILRMPGLPRRPLAESIDLKGGEIEGLQ